ncbi:MAG: TonB-dependent receptor [Colwellia sp.]|nr:TonB-dependent receptor [Colwellia sp.]
MTFKKSSIALSIALCLSTFSSFSQQTNLTNTGANIEANTEDDIEHIEVNSSFRQQSLAKAPASIVVISEQQINDQGMQHFEELLQSVANFNFSGGTSRPKYLQIRGVGERSEYRGAPNASVGFIVDDIDLSGLGMAASMYDVGQVEVLRGPQGTRFGANALAGLVYVQSNTVSQSPEHGFRTTLGDDDLLSIAGFSSNAINEKLSYRISLEQHQQNGYRKNNYLGKDDTNGIDELTGKIKLHYFANDDLTINFTYLFADIDNGFDAWTLDNNGYKTLTDKPGVDSQKSLGSSLKFSYTGLNFANLEAITSVTKTDHHHAYDGDWANPEYWSNKQCTDYYDENGNDEFDDKISCQYEYLWSKQANRDVWSQEFRLVSNESSRIFNQSTDWIAGVYVSELDEDNDLDSSYNGWPDEVVDSNYTANNYAVFTELDSTLFNNYQLSFGLRVERRTVDYSDTLGDKFSPSENMWGGHIALSKSLNHQHAVYARIARGYKAGGFNMGLPVKLAQFKEFDTETLINYEAGIKSSLFDNHLVSRIALFYMDRQNQQVNASQQNPDKPQQFTIYTANATSSSSYGAELELSWVLNDHTSLFATSGYLNATYDDYAYFDKYGTEIDISGRALAHAPKFTYSFGINYRNDVGVFANLNASGKSGFYFSDSHDEQSEHSSLINAKLGYELSNWSVYIWARNLSDQKIATRGFYFGNEPDLDWVNKKYQRFGAPRQIGLTVDYQF